MIEQAPYSQTWPTGSAYISGIDPQDVDFVQYCENSEHFLRTLDQYECAGWDAAKGEYSEVDENTWVSVRKGDLNVIIVNGPLLYIKWVAFTEVARVLGLTDKVERIELSRALVNDNPTAARNIIHLKGTHDTAGTLTLGQMLMSTMINPPKLETT